MEEKTTIFDFFKQVIATYGVIVLVITLTTVVVGDSAVQTGATIYALGAAGLATATLLQLLLLAVLMTIGQWIFLTDKVILRMAMALRCACFIAAGIVGVVICTFAFGWFPVNDMKSWAGFLLSFGACTIVSVIFSVLKEKIENKNMEKALEKIQK